MNEKKIIKDFIDGLPPVNIPSADEAWDNMKQKLNDETKKRPLIGWFWLYPVVFIMLLSGPWFLIQTRDRNEKNAAFINTKTRDAIKGATPGKEKSYEPTAKAQTAQQIIVDGSSPEERESNTTKKRKISDEDSQQKIEASKNPNSNYTDNNKPESISPPPFKARENINGNDSINGLTKIPGDAIANNNDSAGTKTDVAALQGAREDGDKKDAEKETNTNKIIQAGLEWNIQVPLSGVEKYFAGPNGSSEPYRLLLPAVWISMQAEKHLLTAQVNPFATSVLSNKPYSTKNVFNGTDLISETSTLNKLFGVSATVSYDYNVKNRWWLGGNLQGVYWNGGTATSKGVKMNTANGSPSDLYETDYKFNDSAWADFNRFQMGLGTQLTYKLPKLHAGLRLNFYFVPLIDKEGQQNHTTMQVFIRWPFHTHEKKR